MSNKRNKIKKKRKPVGQSNNVKLTPELEEQGKKFWQVVIGVTVLLVVMLFFVFKSFVS